MLCLKACGSRRATTVLCALAGSCATPVQSRAQSTAQASTQGVQWLLKRRYGHRNAPYLGVFLGDHYDLTPSSAAAAAAAASNSASATPAPPVVAAAPQPPPTSSETLVAEAATAAVLTDADMLAIGARRRAEARETGGSSPSDAADNAAAEELRTRRLAAEKAEADAEQALFRRGLYCKALLFVAGNNRRGRDWVCGWACALPGENAPLVPVILQYQASTKDVHRFQRELASRELPHDDERLVANCWCMDAATIVSLAGPVPLCQQPENRLMEASEMLGVPKKWLRQVLELAHEERAVAWAKAQVLEGEGQSDTGDPNDPSGRQF